MLGDPRGAQRLFVLILLVHAVLLGYSAVLHSPTTDEIPQLASGLAHWRGGDFVPYRVTGPLVRLIAALPVLPLTSGRDATVAADRPGARPEFALGSRLIGHAGSGVLLLTTFARWACIPFSLLGCWICYRWGQELFGGQAGLAAAALWAFSPDALGHGPLIMTDIPGAALFIAAGYRFWRWQQAPTTTRALVVGVVLGLLCLTKATYLIVIPVLLPLAWLGAQRRPNVSGDKPASPLLHWGLMVLAALVLINSAYGFAGTGRPLGKYTFVSKLMAGAGQSRQSGNRFRSNLLGSLPVPLPKDFILGVDTQRAYLERGLPSYLRGEWQDQGWWYYYLYAAGVKEPLGTLFLFVGGLAWLTVCLAQRQPLRIPPVLWVPPLLMFVLVSSQTGFNKNFRYAYCVLPALFIVASSLFGTAAADRLRRPIRGVAVAGLLAAAGSSLLVYPHSLSYFHELVGGPSRGHEHLLHTNIDFGQDLLFLKQWLDDHPNGPPLRLAYYGFIDPRLAGIEFSPIPRQLAPEKLVAALPLALLDDAPQPGRYAASINLIVGHQWEAHDGRGHRRWVRRGDLHYLLSFTPTSRAGHSILIYDLSLDDCNAYRREHRLPELAAVAVASPIPADSLPATTPPPGGVPADSSAPGTD